MAYVNAVSRLPADTQTGTSRQKKNKNRVNENSPKSLTTRYIMHDIVSLPFSGAVKMYTGKYYTGYS